MLWPRVGNLNVLLSDASLLLVESVFRLVANALLVTAGMGGAPSSIERFAQADAEGVLLVGKLVNEVARVAPEGQVRVGVGGVEGAAGAVLVVVVQQVGCVGARPPCRRREGVQRDIGRPLLVRVGRNFEG